MKEIRKKLLEIRELYKIAQKYKEANAIFDFVQLMDKNLIELHTAQDFLSKLQARIKEINIDSIVASQYEILGI